MAVKLRLDVPQKDAAQLALWVMVWLARTCFAPSALAVSRMPTRTSPHRPISAPQPAQVTGLSSVAWSGTMSLLPPHLRQVREGCMSHWIGTVMALPPSGTGIGPQLYAQGASAQSRPLPELL